MKVGNSTAKKERIKNLTGQVKQLRSQLEKIAAADGLVTVALRKTDARFERVRNPDGRDSGVGEFFLLVEVTAVKETLYVPTSIASGKKITGFVYHIEGTAQAAISTARISCTGAGVTQVTLGTLTYSKIPKGSTAAFRILIEIKGPAEKAYVVVINRMHYKRNLTDARYERYLCEIRTKTLKSR